MTNKNGIGTLLRSALLITVPVLAVGIMPHKDNDVKNGNGSSPAVSFQQPEYHGRESGIGSVLNEGSMLSRGYGISPETNDNRTDTDLISPLDMTPENPGEKPYPASWGGGGSIVRTTYGVYSGNTYFDLEKCGQVNNKTTIPNETLINESRCLPNFTIKDTDEPQVLIYHTHTTESFEPFVREE